MAEAEPPAQDSRATVQFQFSVKRGSAQFKRHYNAKVHDKPEFMTNRWVFVNKLLFTDAANTEDELTRVSYNKLQLEKAGPLRNIKIKQHTVMSCSTKKMYHIRCRYTDSQ